MAETGPHEALRKEGAATSPDVSYRFVVSFETMQAASAASQAAARKKGRWQRTRAFLAGNIGRLVFGAVLLYLLFRLAVLVYDTAVAASHSTLIAGLLALAVTFITWLGLLLFTRVAAPRLNKRADQRIYQKNYFDNEFLMEGRTSHLWFDDRFVGAIRRWSTFERIVEFEEGMWLMVRRRGLSREGYLISKESLPGSCAWDELKAYVEARITENASSA